MKNFRLLFLFAGIIFCSPAFLRASEDPKKKTAPHTKKKKSDSLDFAPGYPDYSVLAIKQLKYFPLARFKPGVVLHRNFSWFDFYYMAFDYSKVTKVKTGVFVYPGLGKDEHAKAVIEMNYEMVKNWNYYYNIPTPTYNSTYFSKPKSYHGQIISYANLHPEIPVCTYVFWGGVRPSTAGYPSKTPYIKTADAIDPCKNDSTYPSIRIDGILQRKNLERTIAALPNRDPKKKIDFINENGEIFGPVWTPNGEGYRGNPLIACIQKDSSTARKNRGRWQYNVFNTYKKQFIKSDSIPGLFNSEFSFYQISAFLPLYYGEYSEMRKINQFYNKMSYSTPDFYPGDNQHNIFDRYAANHGLNCIAEGRKWEVAQGDLYFSPFICAGWWSDSINYRPAPWLASLKALGAMGAEFYYPSFFNITNPSQKKPVDPAGYIYQVAMPVYAQAITSRYAKIFYNSKDFTYERDGDFLAVYREDKKTKPGLYVINANWFKDGTGNETEEVTRHHSLRVGNEKIKINYRRQGSVYIYDRRDSSNILFYQLDGWHESIHPYYWSRDFILEAELHDDSTDFKMRTEFPKDAAQNDFTKFTTSVSFSSSTIRSPLNFHFHPTEKDSAGYFVWIKARSTKKSSAKILLDGKESGKIENILSEKFSWFCLETKKKPTHLLPSPAEDHVLSIFSLEEGLEIDKIILSVKQNISEENKKE